MGNTPRQTVYVAAMDDLRRCTESSQRKVIAGKPRKINDTPAGKKAS
jgi:hypothetical protein